MICLFETQGEFQVCSRCGRQVRAGVRWRQRCGTGPRQIEHRPCVHLGQHVGFRDCPSCKGNVKKKTFECGKGHGEKTVKECSVWPAICADYQAFGPDRIVRVDLPEGSFNAAIFEDGHKLRLCWRDQWSGSRLWVGDLDEEYRVSNPVKLRLHHYNCRAGREDPRVFRWLGRLHLSFAGVELVNGRTVVNQMLCRLDEAGFQAEEVWYPEYRGRASWEKNWGFFEFADELFCVYTIAPHTILHWDGTELLKAYETAWRPRWTGGALRGGAAPVRVGDEFYSFFHGALDHPGHHPQRTYSLGLYAFEAKAPFKPLRYTREPLMWPPEESRPPNLPVSVVFPCGAVLREGRWLVSYGLHDRWIEIAEFDAAALERMMVKA